MDDPSSARDGVPWFTEDQRPAVADFWRVYEEHFERIRASGLELERRHPELAPLVASTSDPGLRNDNEHAKDLVRRAMAGDGAPYRASLRRHGRACAEIGASFHAACDMANLFTRHVLPRLVEAYGAEAPRLTAAIQAMNDFASHDVAVTAEAYFDRKEVQVRAREQDLATTLDSIGDAVIVTDADGRVTRMNPVAERLTGFSAAAGVGRLLDEVFRIENEDTGGPVESPVARVLREGVIVGLANHTELIASDGTRCPIADSGAPIRRDNGDVRGVVLVFRDVSAERRAEEALRHWERIFQHATWGVALAGAKDVRFQAVNPAYARMHGYTVEELTGAPVSILWAPETREDMERHARETLDHSHLVVETVHLRKDGTRLPVEVVATTLNDAHGQIKWFVANVQDITERKRLQQTRDRAIELEAENRRIEEANRLKGEFLANMSHELRTPLNAIIGFAELLHDEQVGPLATQQKEFLGDILSSGRHLLRLINDVLDLAKVEAGKMEFHAEPVDLPHLVGKVVQSLWATAIDKGFHVEVKVDAALADIALDPGRFRQVLYNYVSNAFKFTPDGGRVVVRVAPEGPEQFRLEVEDTGAGISAENVQHLFIAFQQLDPGTGKRHGGTGLGLALTKRLAEAQGGTVGVRPAIGGGSVFFAVLPRRPASFLASRQRRPVLPGTTKVLVIERDLADQQAVVEILRDAGYDVDVVTTCAEAAAAWRQRAYDAVTFDLLLPDGDGLSGLVQLIRDDGQRPRVPVIAITMVAGKRVAASFEVTDVLTKPVEAAVLLSALKRGGAAPAQGRPVLVIDDDLGSLKLMEVTLEKLGYDSLCFSDAGDALHALERVRPVAVIVDLIMPGIDGLAFLERFRASPENARIPVMIWTVKDLSADERRRLHAAVRAVVQKGVDNASRLSTTLQEFLSAKTSAPEQP